MKRLNTWKLAGAAALVAGFAFAAGAQAPQIAHADLKDKSGKAVGSADFTQTKGGVLIKVSIKDQKAGEHAVHIHTVGKCEAPFESAGPHFNPGNHKHGMLSGDGHAGDLPNLHIPQNGDLEVEMLAVNVTLEQGKPNSLLDNDGSSLVIHTKADDYKSDPDGASGDRLACGVITSSSNVGQSRGR